MASKKLDAGCAALLEESAALYAEAAGTHSSEIDIARAFTDALFKKYGGPTAHGVKRERFDLGNEGAKFEARLYRSEGNRRLSPSPLILFFHGGGWSVGDTEGYEAFLTQLCEKTQADILSIDFRRAPEHNYPCANDDCYLATLWAFASGPELDIDPNQIILMGDSAGANLAISTSLRLTAEDRPPPLALYLLYPFLDASNQHDLYPSRRMYGDGEYLISRDGLELASLWYAGTRGAVGHPDLSPIHQTDLSALPETVIVAAGFDPLLDEANMFASKLKSAGKHVRSLEVAGAIHGFLPFGELALARETLSWIADDVRRCVDRKGMIDQ